MEKIHSFSRGGGPEPDMDKELSEYYYRWAVLVSTIDKEHTDQSEILVSDTSDYYR